MTVDGVAAARTLLSYDGIRGGYCLFYVWQAYKAHGASTGRSAPTATEAWNRSDRRHPGDRNPPPGVPVFWGPKSSSNAGDVVISLGGGRVAATDYPYYGVTGICTIDQRERQIGRPYLGWAECIFDQPIALPDTAGETGKPFEEDDMTPDQSAQLKRVDEFFTALGGVEFAKKLAAVEMFNGVEGVNLSVSRLRLALDAAIDTRERFVVDENGDGVKDYDLTQFAQNRIQPNLNDIAAAINLDALADKIAERLAPGRTS